MTSASLKIKHKFPLSRAIIHLIFWVCGALCILPLLLILSISLTDQHSLDISGFHLIPKVFTWNAYIYVLSGATPVVNAYGVTIFVTFTSVVLNLLLCSLLAYSLTRKEVTHRNKISFFVYIPLLFGGGLVPFYIMMTRYFHLQDTIYILIIVNLIGPVNVLIMKNYFRTIPESLIESSRIDGSGEFRTFFQIVIPLSTPVLATIGLFVAIGTWNDWFTCALYITNVKLYTLQYLLQSLMNNLAFLQMYAANNPAIARMLGNVPQQNARMATCILSIGPIILLYPFLQKYFQKGLTLGGVKE